MNGKIKDPDKRIRQDPPWSCNILTFSQGTRSEPLVAWEALTMEHIDHEVIGRGASWEDR